MREIAFVVGGRVREESNQIEDLDLLLHARNSGDVENQAAFNEVLVKHRDRLKRMVALRLNDRLKSRVDASDVIQESYVEAARSLDAYLENPKLSVYLWLRKLAGQKLVQAHRKHIGAQKRSAEKELAIYGGVPAASSQSIAMELTGKVETPSKVAQDNEAKDRLMKALQNMDDLDREVLTLRHFEHLTGRETAEVLGMSHEAIKKRYIRALDKLQKILAE